MRPANTNDDKNKALWLAVKNQDITVARSLIEMEIFTKHFLEHSYQEKLPGVFSKHRASYRDKPLLNDSISDSLLTFANSKSNREIATLLKQAKWLLDTLYVCELLKGDMPYGFLVLYYCLAELNSKRELDTQIKQAYLFHVNIAFSQVAEEYLIFNKEYSNMPQHFGFYSTMTWRLFNFDKKPNREYQSYLKENNQQIKKEMIKHLIHHASRHTSKEIASGELNFFTLKKLKIALLKSSLEPLMPSLPASEVRKLMINTLKKFFKNFKKGREALLGTTTQFRIQNIYKELIDDITVDEISQLEQCLFNLEASAILQRMHKENEYLRYLLEKKDFCTINSVTESSLFITEKRWDRLQALAVDQLEQPSQSISVEQKNMFYRANLERTLRVLIGKKMRALYKELNLTGLQKFKLSITTNTETLREKRIAFSEIVTMLSQNPISNRQLMLILDSAIDAANIATSHAGGRIKKSRLAFRLEELRASPHISSVPESAIDGESKASHSNKENDPDGAPARRNWTPPIGIAKVQELVPIGRLRASPDIKPVPEPESAIHGESKASHSNKENDPDGAPVRRISGGWKPSIGTNAQEVDSSPLTVNPLELLLPKTPNHKPNCKTVDAGAAAEPEPKSVPVRVRLPC